MLNINASTQVSIACGATDLRKSIDGLSTIVQDEFKMNPFSEQLFVFCNQNRNRIKVLHWDHHAFWLYYRRLEQGTYKWPQKQAEMSLINLNEFQWLLDGLSLMQYQEKHQSDYHHNLCRITVLKGSENPGKYRLYVYSCDIFTWKNVWNAF